MLLSVSKNALVRGKDIIGIFNADTATISKVTRDFLSSAQKNGMIDPFDDIPKAILIHSENLLNSAHTVYFSQRTVESLVKKLNFTKG